MPVLIDLWTIFIHGEDGWSQLSNLCTPLLCARLPGQYRNTSKSDSW